MAKIIACPVEPSREGEGLSDWLSNNREAIGDRMLRTLTWIHAEAFEESLANDPDFMSTTTVRPDGSLGQLWGRRKDRTDLARARSHNKANDN